VGDHWESPRNQSDLSTIITILLSAALSLLPIGQAGFAQSLDALKNRIMSEYSGSYLCLQGETSLTIQFLRPASDSQAAAIFKFGPSPDNQSVPVGAFLLTGTVDLSGGRLDLQPLSWLSQPPGYMMVGLSGTSSDGGKTFEGVILNGIRCSTFSINRVSQPSAATLPAPAPTSTNRSRQQAAPPLRGGDLAKTLPQESSQRRSGATEIPLQNLNGVFVIPVSINGAITLNFTIDSGATDVSIPADVVLTLMRTGTLRDTDFLGQKTYRLADGSTVPSQTFRIRALKIGDREIQNVTGSVAAVEGSLLLGQSFLSRFRSWSINNQRHVLVLE
jgi:clan AA aspartic protease (TIGR02281 family)